MSIDVGEREREMHLLKCTLSSKDSFFKQNQQPAALTNAHYLLSKTRNANQVCT